MDAMDDWVAVHVDHFYSNWVTPKLGKIPQKLQHGTAELCVSSFISPHLI